MELTDQIYDKIIELCDQGDQYIENGDYNKAVDIYTKALDLVPSPKTDWEASTWIYTAIGDAYFFLEDFSKATDNFYNVLNCPGGLSNPYVLLRLGESLFENGDSNKAKEYLLKAYMLDGKKIFDEEDIKYFNHIKDII
ncbi:MAG: tetratricopeptide repeat protein [Proteobacteria bacterium]|nr:tetratricopeptide repeat protein [Pseudomonadota bacterium]